MAVSRFRTALGVYHYGPLRRSDWLPTKENPDADEQVQPSELSPRDWEDSCSDSDSERWDVGAHFRGAMGAEDSSDSEGGADLGAHYRSSMGGMGGSSSGSEDCWDGSGDGTRGWGGGGGEFGAGAEMAGSDSESAGSGSDVPDGGFRCGELELSLIHI